MRSQLPGRFVLCLVLFCTPGSVYAQFIRPPVIRPVIVRPVPPPRVGGHVVHIPHMAAGGGVPEASGIDNELTQWLIVFVSILTMGLLGASAFGVWKVGGLLFASPRELASMKRFIGTGNVFAARLALLVVLMLLIAVTPFLAWATWFTWTNVSLENHLLLWGPLAVAVGAAYAILGGRKGRDAFLAMNPGRRMQMFHAPYAFLVIITSLAATIGAGVAWIQGEMSAVKSLIAIGFVAVIFILYFPIAFRWRRPKAYIVITDVPPGDAPEEVRRAWIDVAIPLEPDELVPQIQFVVGSYSAVTPTLDQCYAVDADTAIRCLAYQSPEAAAWWKDNHARFVGNSGHYLVFPAWVCKRIPELPVPKYVGLGIDGNDGILVK